MKIELLEHPEGAVVARGLMPGQPEGEFLLNPDGEVIYCHPWEERFWVAGPNLEAFRAAALAWIRHNEASDDDRDAAWRWSRAHDLRAELTQAGVVTDRHDGLWTILLEQAEGKLA